MLDSSSLAGGETPDTAERMLDLLAPALTVESLEELAVAGARIAGALAETSTIAFFLARGREITHEAWHSETEAMRARLRPHLRGLALESLTAGGPVVTPFPDGAADAGVPVVVLLLENGKIHGVLCAACPGGAPGEATSVTARLERLAPLLARQIVLRQESAAPRATLARYERWFKQLDQHVRVLDRERQKFAAIVNQSDTYVFTTNTEGIIGWVNRAMSARAPQGREGGWIGCPSEDVWTRFGGREVAEGSCPVRRALASSQPAHGEFREVDEQSVRNFYVTALPIRSPEGGTHEILTIVQDLSGLDSLRVAEQRLKTLVSNAPIVLFALDADGVFTLSEGRGLEVLGLRPGEAVGCSALEMYEEHPVVIGHMRRALAGEEFGTRVDIGELTFETLYTPLRSVTGELTGTLGVATDVSERSRLEEQLRHAHKMEGIGRLAGGVAHDFNNLLTVIMGNAELILSQMRADHPQRACAEKMHLAASQGALLTRQLLSFSRRDHPVVGQLDLNVTVREMEDMLRRIIGVDIEVDTVLSEEPAIVLADRSQIEQVIMNLAVNARDAMPHGGRLTLHVENGEPEEIALTVVDSGSGMSEETQAHLFEPFFTTKERGKGTGLGLALVQGIVQGAGGTVAIDSALGRGTSVRVVLPRPQLGHDAGITARAA
jgi:PAS domain S-box-containing protein